MDITAPQISLPTSNCSPMIARTYSPRHSSKSWGNSQSSTDFALRHTRSSQYREAMPLRMRTIHLPPRRFAASYAIKSSVRCRYRYAHSTVWTYLPHGLDARLEEMVVHGVGQIVWPHEVVVHAPEALHLSMQTHKLSSLSVMQTCGHALTVLNSPSSLMLFS